MKEIEEINLQSFIDVIMPHNLLLTVIIGKKAKLILLSINTFVTLWKINLQIIKH